MKMALFGSLFNYDMRRIRRKLPNKLIAFNGISGVTSIQGLCFAPSGCECYVFCVISRKLNNKLVV